MKIHCLSLVLTCLVVSVCEGSVLVDRQPGHVGSEASDTDFLGTWQLFADSFVIAGEGSVSHVTWWGLYGGWGTSTHAPAGDEAMRITFYEARAGDGLPGQILYQENVLNPQRVATGVNLIDICPDCPEYKYDVDLSSPVSVSASAQYWLEIAQVGLSNSIFHWLNSDDINIAYGDAYINPYLSDWSFIPHEDLSFQLQGTPEPASAVALGIGGALVMRRRRLA